MKNMLKAMLVAAAPVAILAAAPTVATAQTKSGIAIVDADRAGSQSTAFTNAMNQIKTRYAAQISQINSRQSAINADISSKQSALQAAAQAAGQSPTPAQQASLQSQYETLQKSAQAGQAELQRLGQPVALAQEYVRQQVANKLTDAIKNAMKKNNVEIVLNAEATEYFVPSAEITNQVIAELNAILPSVSIDPPAGWRPDGAGAGGAPAASGGR